MYPVVYVEWVDAAIIATRWDDREHVVNETAEAAAGSIKTAGFLIENNDRGMTVALSLNERNDDIQLALFIPKSGIQHMSVWAPERAD